MKRLTYILLIVLLCSSMVVGALALLVRSARVQTAMVGLLTEELSRGLNADVHIDQVRFRLLRTLELDGVYLSDQTGDTLMYVPHLKVAFDPFAIDDNRLRFPSIELQNPYFSIWQDSTATNLDFLVRAFAPEDTVPLQLPMPITMEDIRIEGARIRYQHAPSQTDVLFSDIDADIRLPYIDNDSVNAQLVGLGVKARLRNVDATVDAHFRGDRDSVFADHVNIVYRDQQLLKGFISIADPLHLDLTHIVVDCQDLFCNERLLSDLLSDLLHHPVRLPQELRQLGDMHYHGLLSGDLGNLNLHGAFTSRLGTITTYGTLSTDTSFADIRFKGEISTRRFRLGQFYKDADLGDIAFAAQATAHYQAGQPLQAQGTMRVSSFTFKDYTYKNLLINGSLAQQVFHGHIGMNDPNLTFTLNGEFGFNQSAPWADIAFRLEHLKLGQLHLYEDCQDEDASLKMHLHFTSNAQEGNWLNSINGALRFDSIFLTNYGEEAHIERLELGINDSQRKTTLHILSEHLNMGISGSFDWTTLGATLQQFGHELFPSMIARDNTAHLPNDLDFYVYFKNLTSLARLGGDPDISIPRNPTIKGFIHESDRQFEVRTYIPAIENGNAATQDITCSLLHSNKQSTMLMALVQHTINMDSTKLRIGDVNVRFCAQAKQDSIFTSLKFGNPENMHQDANIRVNARLSKYNRYPLISAHILPSVFYLKDTLWTLNDAHIEYSQADTILRIANFGMQSRSGKQFLHANGIVSGRAEDSIRIDFNDFDLHYFLQYVGLENAVSIKGMASGWASLYALFSRPMFEANVRVPDAQLNDMSLGYLTAKASLDRETNHILIDADAVENQRTIAHVDGNVIPEEAYWELFIHADSANVQFINFWTEGMIENITGRAFGDVHVFGRKLDTWVTAKAFAKDAALTIPFTNTRYYFSDSVILDTTRITFPAIHIRDAEGHKGVVSGELNHDRFKDFKFRIHGDFRDLMALNIPYSSQTMFYGKAYASGKIDIVGDDRMTNIDINATTRGNTDFYLCIATASDAKDNSFITFVDNDVVYPFKAKQAPQPAHAPAKFILNMSIDATPDARIHLMLDPHSGDGIDGRGEGQLRLSMDGTTGDISLFGTYAMLSGTFSYAVANILRRDFAIAEGSSIAWGGNPMTPTLNAKAIYRLTASLKDLFGTETATLASNRTSVPVECTLHLSGSLFNPVMRFGIDLPQSDEVVNAQVKAIITSDEMLMRQVLYLLIFNRFFTPEYLTSTTNGANDAYSLLSSTVTGQINTWLSRLTDIVSVGFNFRSDGEGAGASQEYETQFRLQPVRRLSINGNFGYRYNDISNKPFFGDVDIEYQLTPNGKLRARAFTHTVDKYSMKQATMEEGIGLIFRHDFNWGDARRKREQKAQQKARQKAQQKAEQPTSKP